MLPGAVSLGAYEGGAVAAILLAVQASDGDLVIDAIASASAGSMTGLIASRALLCGSDPITLMKKTWVDLPSIQTLEADENLQAPLSMEGLIDGATRLLSGLEATEDPSRTQGVDVRLSMALTALGGLTYNFARTEFENPPSGNTPKTDVLPATTYSDLFDVHLPVGAQNSDFTAALKAAMASGATPVGFPPRLLDRSDDRASYADKGIVTPPDGQPFKLWYSDGGDIDNQPLGRLIDLIGTIDEGPDQRVIVMLNIEPAGEPTFQGTWFEKEQPSWLSTLLHVNHIRSQQNLYSDLEQLEKINQRLRWIDEVASALDREFDPETRAVAANLAAERSNIDNSLRAKVGAPQTDGPVPAQTVRELLLQAAGLEGKRQIPVEVISPEIDDTDQLTAKQQLSGEFLFHFGGFFDATYRGSDFALGYKDAEGWLTRWLKGQDCEEKVLQALTAGRASVPPLLEGNASARRLSLVNKIRGVDLLGHIVRVTAYDTGLDIAAETERVESVLRRVFDVLGKKDEG